MTNKTRFSKDKLTSLLDVIILYLEATYKFNEKTDLSKSLSRPSNNRIKMLGKYEAYIDLKKMILKGDL